MWQSLNVSSFKVKRQYFLNIVIIIYVYIGFFIFNKENNSDCLIKYS